MMYQGGCHCGAIRFEVDASEDLEVEDCNCSMCRMTGFLHLIVPASRFRLLAGQDAITTYRFNTGVAQHTFCRVCGVKPFYVPRSNPDGVDVNVRCLDAPPSKLTVVPFDGRNWEANAHTLAHKSADPRLVFHNARDTLQVQPSGRSELFSHIMIGANDVAASKRFYDAVLGALGHKPGVMDPKGRCFYRSDSGVFALTKPINGQPASAGNGSTIGFVAASPEAAKAWHAAGLANGGTTCEDPPGVREGSGLYLAYLRDPSGNKICALHRMR